MLLRVVIKNFRSCRDVVLDDLEGILALVGRNGAGKTNILRAIEWAAKTAVSNQPSAGDILQLIVSGGALPDVSLTFKSGRNTYIYSIAQVPTTPDNARSMFSFGLVEKLATISSSNEVTIVSRQREKVSIHETGQELSIGGATPMLKALIAILPEDGALHGLLMDAARFLERVRYYPLEKMESGSRFVQGPDYQAWSEALASSGGLTDDSVVMRLIDLHLQRPDDFREVAELVGPNGLNIISNMSVQPLRLPKQHPPSDDDSDSDTDTELLEASTPPDFYLVSFSPTGFEKKKSQHPFGFEDLSYGSKRLLTIITSLVYDRSTVLLIEQPEDGIHIGLLNKLTPMLRAYSDSMQFILASHSRDVLDRFQPTELRLVRLAEGTSSVRALTAEEIATAEGFISEEGPLSDFIETLEGD